MSEQPEKTVNPEVEIIGKIAVPVGDNKELVIYNGTATYEMVSNNGLVEDTWMIKVDAIGQSKLLGSTANVGFGKFQVIGGGYHQYFINGVDVAVINDDVYIKADIHLWADEAQGTSIVGSLMFQLAVYRKT